MYILTNACKNILRNKGRNGILSLIAVLTLSSVMLSFSIKTIAEVAVMRYKNNFGVKAEITPDWEKMEKDFPPTETVNEDGSITQESSYELPELTMEEYLNYADSKHVMRTLFSASCAFSSDTLSAVPDNLHPDEEVIDIAGMTLEELKKFFNAKTQKELEQAVGGLDELKKIMDTKPNCIGTVNGFTDVSLMEDFTDGKRKLEEGRFPKKNGECIISTRFAEENHLKTGDTISLSGPSKSDTKKITFSITGIYGDYFSQATAASLGMVYDEVITTFDTLIGTGFHYIYSDNAEFILKDPDAADAFLKELYQKGMSEYRTLSYSTEEYEQNTKPLKNLSNIAKIFTLSASIIGSAILLLISIINVRERKYEIGVLRAMGMKKTKVAKGMLFETAGIMLGCFLLSITACKLSIRPIAFSLITSLTDETISLPPVAITSGALMAFILSTLSGICAVFAVMRHEPMKILSERNH